MKIEYGNKVEERNAIPTEQEWKMANNLVKMLTMTGHQPHEISTIANLMELHINLLFCESQEHGQLNIKSSNEFLKENFDENWPDREKARASFSQQIERASPLQTRIAEVMRDHKAEAEAKHKAEAN